MFEWPGRKIRLFCYAALSTRNWGLVTTTYRRFELASRFEPSNEILMAKKTTKRKAVKKKAAKRARPATREANPSWLVSDPVGEPPKPPVVSRASNNLPFLQLRWEDFERLC